MGRGREMKEEEREEKRREREKRKEEKEYEKSYHYAKSLLYSLWSVNYENIVNVNMSVS
jgi:hypothetical protein